MTDAKPMSRQTDQNGVDRYVSTRSPLVGVPLGIQCIRGHVFRDLLLDSSLQTAALAFFISVFHVGQPAARSEVGDTRVTPG